MAAVAGEATGAAVEIADGVYLLTGLGCNVLAVAVTDGVLIIDSGSDGDAQKLKRAIAELDAGPVRFVLNTHSHLDHVWNNEVLARNGAVIIAHERVRRSMQAEWRVPDALGLPAVPPYPEVALPTLTFADALTVHLGGHEIAALCFRSAHSDADAAVLLREANVLHTGDLYLSNGFPLIDSFHGGTIDGVITAVDALTDLMDDETKVVPGHGSLSNCCELREYRHMLAVARDRITALIEGGSTLEEVVAANPTAGLYRRGESWMPTGFFVLTVYEDLVRRHAPAGDVRE